MDAITENVTEPEVPPPGGGLRTLIFRIPGDPKLVAGITAVRVVGLMTVVGIAAPLICTSELARKSEPVRVTAVFPLPCGPELGLILAVFISDRTKLPRASST